jgi:hypothetical protein
VSAETERSAASFLHTRVAHTTIMTTAGDSLSPSGYLSGQASVSSSPYCSNRAAGLLRRSLGEYHLIFSSVRDISASLGHCRFIDLVSSS